MNTKYLTLISVIGITVLIFFEYLYVSSESAEPLFSWIYYFIFCVILLSFYVISFNHFNKHFH